MKLKSEGWEGTRMEAGCTVAFCDFKVVSTVQVWYSASQTRKLEFVRLSRVDLGTYSH